MEAIQIGRRTLPALGIGLAGCDAQASEHYQGEPLLTLKGQVTVNALTGGQPITPALCVHDPLDLLGYSSYGTPEPIAPEAFPAAASPAFQTNLQTRFWPHRDTTIVSVESKGLFPADFNVSLYQPPGDDALKPQFDGEPRMARGTVCAVRAEHPAQVSMLVFGFTESCGDGENAACERQMLWMMQDTKRHYLETYACPNARARNSDCALTTDGDAALKREYYDSVLGEDANQVVYLAEPAPAGSYTAWLFGAKDGLSVGYHVFAPYGDFTEAPGGDTCSTQAYVRADALVREQFADHIVADPELGRVVEPAFAKAARELAISTFAEIRMAECDAPIVSTLSPDEPLSITINQDRVPGYDPFPLATEGP